MRGMCGSLDSEGTMPVLYIAVVCVCMSKPRSASCPLAHSSHTGRGHSHIGGAGMAAVCVDVVLYRCRVVSREILPSGQPESNIMYSLFHFHTSEGRHATNHRVVKATKQAERGRREKLVCPFLPILEAS